MTKDTTWRVTRGDAADHRYATPLHFDSRESAKKWIARNQPLFPETLVPAFYFLTNKEVIQEEHDKFVMTVTGKNALSYK